MFPIVFPERTGRTGKEASPGITSIKVDWLETLEVKEGAIGDPLAKEDAGGTASV